MLVEELVGLRVQRLGRRIPHHLIDADALVALAMAETDEEHRVAGHGGDVDGTREGNGQARLQVEAIERPSTKHETAHEYHAQIFVSIVRNAGAGRSSTCRAFPLALE